jgi:long-chain acyl-CoA synthetase
MADFKNLGDLIRRDRDLTKIAIVDLGGEQGPRDFTFAQLDTMANGVARALAKRGLQRGDRIALLSANRAEYIAAYYGIMRAGLVAVPVNFKFPRDTIRFIIRDSGAKLVFCDAPRALDCPADIPSVTFGTNFDAFLDSGPFDAVIPAQDEPAMFLYTSGSTGTPKGVVLSHQSHIWVVETRLAPGLDRHRYLIAAPLYHMNALALAKLASAAHATIVLLPQFSAPAYIAAIGKYCCTWLTAVPPMIAMMLRETSALETTDLSSVEFVRMGSAPVSASLMAALHDALPRASVTNAYGTTEAGPVVFGPHPKGLPQPELSVGYPHAMVALRLVDGADRNAAQGVLEMKCPALMLGYHNRPEVAPPLTPDGFYITGDVFRRDADGFHYFVGRTDDMFVSGGENIYPADVERMLERHPDIAQAAVVPIDDDIKGQKPVAFVIKKPGRALDGELPLASTNKLDRAALHAMAEERIADERT